MDSPKLADIYLLIRGSLQHAVDLLGAELLSVRISVERACDRMWTATVHARFELDDERRVVQHAVASRELDAALLAVAKKCGVAL